MGNGLNFKVAGIPVRVEWLFVIVAVFLGLAGRSGGLLVAWVVIVFVSVLLHELGHAFAFRMFGHQPRIVLTTMGGETSAGAVELTARRDLAVSLAGPLTGVILLGLPALYLARTMDLSADAETVLSDLVWVNIGWSVVNLLPVLPLDGGRVMAAILSLATNGGGRRTAHIVSAVVAGAGGLFALVNGYVFGAVFAGLFASMNIRALSSGRDQQLINELAEGWVSMSRGDTEAGAKSAQRVLGDRPTAAVIAPATELLAWSHLVSGNAAEAAKVLTRFPPGFAPDPLLLGAIELDGGRSATALDRLVEGYARGRFGPATKVVASAVANAGLDSQLADRLLAPGGPGPAAAGQFATHLHDAGRYEEAMAVGRRALASGAPDDNGPDGLGRPDARGQIAYNLACSHARADQPDAALDWLEKAADLGFADAALVGADPDLDALRGLPRFAVLQKRLTHGA